MSKFEDPFYWTVLGPLYSHLVTLGNYFPLSVSADSFRVKEQLAQFENDWRIYNPKKPDYKRQGLSVTSIDGSICGEKDLTSLREVNLAHGTDYNELSFRTLTKVYEQCSAIHPIVEPFIPFLGRSHFLRFGLGGFFPWHRDSYTPDGDTFRIFVPFVRSNTRDFIFLLGNERLNLESGRAYFINTRVEHAIFSLEPNSVHLVLNIELNAKSVEQVCKLVFSP